MNDKNYMMVHGIIAFDPEIKEVKANGGTKQVLQLPVRPIINGRFNHKIGIVRCTIWPGQMRDCYADELVKGAEVLVEGSYELQNGKRHTVSVNTIYRAEVPRHLRGDLPAGASDDDDLPFGDDDSDDLFNIR